MEKLGTYREVIVLVSKIIIGGVLMCGHTKDQLP